MLTQGLILNLPPRQGVKSIETSCIPNQHECRLLIFNNLTFTVMQKYICKVCKWVYDPEIGDPEHGIAPGTPFEEIPDDWRCPKCGVKKAMFEPYEG